MTTQHYLLDKLETADILETDGLHAWRFELNESPLDQTDLAAEASQPFASEDWVLVMESLDGCTRREWRSSYNAVMEAEPQADGESWRLTTEEGAYQLRCLGVVSASGEDEWGDSAERCP